MATDPWSEARELLYLFNGSEHISPLAEACCHGKAEAKAWRKNVRTNCASSGTDGAHNIAALTEPSREAKEVVRKAKYYFANQSGKEIDDVAGRSAAAPSSPPAVKVSADPNVEGSLWPPRIFVI